MTSDDLLLSCNILGIYPRKYDNEGWTKVMGTLSLLGADLVGIDTSTLPKSKKDIDSIASDIKKRMGRASSAGTGGTLDADFLANQPDDRKIKIFDDFINRLEESIFPPYVEEVDPAIQEYIKQNFMYTYSNDGKVIVYSRLLDEPGNVWEEVPNSETPFEMCKGTLRKGLINTLVIRSRSKVVTVYIDNKGKSEVYEHIAYWMLFKKYEEQIMARVTGRPENVELVREHLHMLIDIMKKGYNGTLQHRDLANGLQKIPDMLHELDAGINNNTFFYHPSISLPSLTNDPNESAMAYFDLSTITAGPTPDFDGFMSAIVPECRDSLMAAIFATFFAKSHLNQYIWIHGEGGDGKSSLLNAIAAYAGPHLACSLGQTMNSEFGLENAVGKRMVILSDVKTGLSVKSQLIHNLTGHDMISVNRKNKPIISVRLDPIVWIAANEAPDVNFDNRNEARRCLYIKMQEPPVEVKRKFYFTNPDGSFVVDNEGRPINNGYDLEGNLIKEMPHILHKCKEAFMRVCPAPYSVIKPNVDAIAIAEDNCLDIDASTFNTYIAETFDFTDKTALLKQTEIFEALSFTMKKHDDKGQMSNFIKRDVRRILTVKYGCKRKKVGGIYYMEGLSVNPNFDMYDTGMREVNIKKHDKKSQPAWKGLA